MQRAFVLLLLVCFLLVQVPRKLSAQNSDAIPKVVEVSAKLFDKNHGTLEFRYTGNDAVVYVYKRTAGYGDVYLGGIATHDGQFWHLNFPPYACCNDYTLFPYESDQFWFDIWDQTTGLEYKQGFYRWTLIQRRFLPLLLSSSSVPAAPKQTRYLPVIHR